MKTSETTTQLKFGIKIAFLNRTVSEIFRMDFFLILHCQEEDEDEKYSLEAHSMLEAVVLWIMLDNVYWLDTNSNKVWDQK